MGFLDTLFSGAKAFIKEAAKLVGEAVRVMEPLNNMPIPSSRNSFS
jgi:hypothetical protein